MKHRFLNLPKLNSQVKDILPSPANSINPVRKHIFLTLLNRHASRVPIVTRCWQWVSRHGSNQHLWRRAARFNLQLKRRDLQLGTWNARTAGSYIRVNSGERPTTNAVGKALSWPAIKIQESYGAVYARQGDQHPRTCFPSTRLTNASKALVWREI